MLAFLVKMCYGRTTMKNNDHKWIKTRVNLKDLKKLKKLAVDKEVSLSELLREALRTLLKEEKEINCYIKE